MGLGWLPWALVGSHGPWLAPLGAAALPHIIGTWAAEEQILANWAAKDLSQKSTSVISDDGI